ncbi:MAG: AtpZ/AtpI family protein [Lutibacter sp.]|jgi:hypothetical protein|nr:AtpZ/AtpI family protein [Lutibacter sp.]
MSKKKKQLPKFVRLSGLAFQMGITIYLGAYVGKKLDAYAGYSGKTFTLIGILFAFCVSMYSLLLQLKKINDQDG